MVINLFTSWDDSPSTPRKINMVHLQISHLERKMIWTKPPTSGVGGMILQVPFHQHESPPVPTHGPMDPHLSSTALEDFHGTATPGTLGSCHDLFINPLYLYIPLYCRYYMYINMYNIDMNINMHNMIHNIYTY